MVVLAMLAGVARAAPPWSPPENVSSPSLFVNGPDVVVDGQGRAFATWVWTRITEPDSPSGTRVAVREPGATEFGPERDAPRFAAPLVAYGLNRVLGLDQRSRGPHLISLRARFGRPDGTFGRPDTISSYRPASAPSLAVHDDVLVAWVQRASRGRRVVRAAIRRPGHRFGRPMTLRARGRARNVVAAAGPGAMFVAWERAGVVEARVRLTGRGWGPVRRLGRAAKGSNTFRAVFSGRRGYLAWLAQGPESAFIRTAVLPAGRARFLKAKPVTLCPPSLPCLEERILHEAPVEGQALRLVALPHRDALLAWSRWYIHPGVWSVRAALTGGGTEFRSPFDVSPQAESSVLSDVASGPRSGAVMFVWSRLDAVGELGDRVRARIFAPGAGFRDAEDVSDLDRARLPAVAFDFTSQRWTAVWSQRIGPDGPGVPQNQITTFLRSATRPG